MPPCFGAMLSESFEIGQRNHFRFLATLAIKEPAPFDPALPPRDAPPARAGGDELSQTTLLQDDGSSLRQLSQDRNRRPSLVARVLITPLPHLPQGWPSPGMGSTFGFASSQTTWLQEFGSSLRQFEQDRNLLPLRDIRVTIVPEPHFGQDCPSPGMGSIFGLSQTMCLQEAGSSLR